MSAYDCFTPVLDLLSGRGGRRRNRGAQALTSNGESGATEAATLPLTAHGEAGRGGAEGAPSEAAQLAIQNHTERVQKARIEELEARVSATLHAAVARSQRIAELEEEVRQGKKNEIRIRELELAVQETAREASARAERVRALEAELAHNGGLNNDPAANAALQDAMRTAKELLGTREDLMLDNGTIMTLREAVDEVQLSRAGVSAPIADLIGKLVVALKWPMALRERLAIAEQTVNDQKRIQDDTLKELHGMQQQKALDETGLRKAEAEVNDLRQQLAKAREVTEDAVTKLKSLETASHVEEMQLLQKQRALEATRREEAEARTRDLEARLVDANKAIAASEARNLSLLDEARTEGMQEFQRQREENEEGRRQAEEQAFALRAMLGDAQQQLDESVARQKLLREAHEEEVRRLRKQHQEIEAKKQQSEADVRQLKERLTHAESRATRLSMEQQEALDSVVKPFQEDVRKLREQHDDSEQKRREVEHEAKELKKRLQAAEKSIEYAEKQSRADAVRSDEITRDLQNRLNAAEVAAQATASQQRALLGEVHEEELTKLQKRRAAAEQEKERALQQAAELRTHLVNVEQAAAEAATRQKIALHQQHDDELKALQKKQAAAEASKDLAELQARELRQRLAAAESATNQVGAAREDAPTAAPATGVPISRRPVATSGSLGVPASPGTGPTSSFDSAAADSLSHWLAAADQAAEKLKETQTAADRPDFPRFIPTHQVAETKLELDHRLAAAERALGSVKTSVNVSRDDAAPHSSPLRSVEMRSSNPGALGPRLGGSSNFSRAKASPHSRQGIGSSSAIATPVSTASRAGYRQPPSAAATRLSAAGPATAPGPVYGATAPGASRGTPTVALRAGQPSPKTTTRPLYNGGR